MPTPPPDPDAWVPAGPGLLPASLEGTPADDGGERTQGAALDAPDHDGAPHRGSLLATALSAAARTGRRGPPITTAELTVHELTADEDGGLDSLTYRQPDPVHTEIDLRGLGERSLGSVRLEYAGHDPVPRVPDLQELAGGALPRIDPDATASPCWVCGVTGWLTPRPRDAESVLAAWAPGEEAADPEDTSGPGERVSPSAIAVAVACPATWLAGRPADRIVLRFFGTPPTYEPLRLVARRDEDTDGVRRVRVALVDDEARVHAVAATEHRPD